MRTGINVDVSPASKIWAIHFAVFLD
jgi:hypothetical protein